MNEILNIETILVLMSNRSLHLQITSDLEITRWKKFLYKFLKRNPKNHEWLFGMSQINFSIGMHDIAIDYITRAIEYSKGLVSHYLVWKAIFLYFIYLNNKSDSKDKSNKTTTYYLNWEWAALAAEKQAPENIAINFMILKLSIEKNFINEKSQRTFIKCSESS